LKIIILSIIIILILALYILHILPLFLFFYCIIHIFPIPTTMLGDNNNLDFVMKKPPLANVKYWTSFFTEFKRVFDPAAIKLVYHSYTTSCVVNNKALSARKNGYTIKHMQEHGIPVNTCKEFGDLYNPDRPEGRTIIALPSSTGMILHYVDDPPGADADVHPEIAFYEFILLHVKEALIFKFFQQNAVDNNLSTCHAGHDKTAKTTSPPPYMELNGTKPYMLAPTRQPTVPRGSASSDATPYRVPPKRSSTILNRRKASGSVGVGVGARLHFAIGVPIHGSGRGSVPVLSRHKPALVRSCGKIHKTLPMY